MMSTPDDQEQRQITDHLLGKTADTARRGWNMW